MNTLAHRPSDETCCRPTEDEPEEDGGGLLGAAETTEPFLEGGTETGMRILAWVFTSGFCPGRDGDNKAVIR